MNSAILANPAARTDHGVRPDLRACSNMRIFSNDRVRSDSDARRNTRERRHNCRRMNSRGDRRAPEQQLCCARESHFWWTLRSTVMPASDTPSVAIAQVAAEPAARSACFADST